MYGGFQMCYGVYLLLLRSETGARAESGAASAGELPEEAKKFGRIYETPFMAHQSTDPNASDRLNYYFKERGHKHGVFDS